jgi:hypothetical protein
MMATEADLVGPPEFLGSVCMVPVVHYHGYANEGSCADDMVRGRVRPDFRFCVGDTGWAGRNSGLFGRGACWH